MKFWVPTCLAFGALVTLVCFSMAVPRLMMGQSVLDYWMRELVLVGVFFVNVFSVVSFLALVTWLDVGETKE